MSEHMRGNIHFDACFVCDFFHHTPCPVSGELFVFVVVCGKHGRSHRFGGLRMAEVTGEIAVELSRDKQGAFFFAFARNAQQSEVIFRFMRLEAADFKRGQLRYSESECPQHGDDHEVALFYPGVALHRA